MAERGLIANISLAALGENIRHATEIGLLHNANDIILKTGAGYRKVDGHAYLCGFITFLV